ncbi:MULTISPECIES: transcription antitermination factor NusB [unclassified Actinomyces]|uniref:transcription antitermination factor NusB n=1 Tax=unclassified Actinomyces TaxID=2609248 RepID=UPI0020181FD9|nr:MULTISPECIES: transcription antitermination factor NusB [unclassified Actinomyces]MCL3778718.1 transcription antitermination factor NusB [Actinomyces sp. AC-20-1]MCL3789209.1 transcription antitermination factor NusB [Actinomyces sp. 187325]MCL3791396.1 transcription antitermination factor NusB [Actinomyces sp. 186855]MCL3793579.1 transcription antitermination factor NusB [Actinomyces sp. 217892]
MTETTPRAEAPESSAAASDGGTAGAPRPVKHPVTARTKARRRAIEVLFEADQRGMLGRGRRRDAEDERHWGERDEHAPAQAPVTAAEAAQTLRDFAARRAVESANHTEAPAYTREILTGVADHLADVDDTIETYAQDWTLARMPAVDRAIARVATWEIVYNDDVDAPVAVDEAMTLARMLSTDDSPRYLGGLLGRIGDLADTLR